MVTKILNGADLQAQRIQNMADPSSATDAATKQYVDALVNGLSWKDEVRVATTTAGTLASSFANGSVIDGQTLATGDRILIKDQASGSENGIYVVAASGAPTRSTDANTATNIKSATVLVTAGTTNADKAFTLTTDSVTIGTTALTFVQFGGGLSYTAGNGLGLAGSSFSVTPLTNGGISVAAGGVGVIAPAAGGLVVGSTGVSAVANTGITVGTSGIGIDTSVVARKYAVNVPSGSTTATITHNLGTTDVIVQVYEITGGAMVMCDVQAATTNTVVLTNAVTWAASTYRCVVHG